VGAFRQRGEGKNTGSKKGRRSREKERMEGKERKRENLLHSF